MTTDAPVMVRITDHIMLRHDALVRVTFTERGTDRVLDVSEVPAENVGGHLTVMSITWNALSNSGGVRWRNPSTGEYVNGLQYVVDVEERFVLRDGALCTCKKCLPNDQEG